MLQKPYIVQALPGNPLISVVCPLKSSLTQHASFPVERVLSSFPASLAKLYFSLLDLNMSSCLLKLPGTWVFFRRTDEDT
jgi:hypothetical protein